MTIELSVMPEGTRNVIPVTGIAPGESGGFVDYSVDPPRMVCIDCHPDNSGGSIYGVDPKGDLLDMGGYALVNMSLKTPDTLISDVPQNGEYELPIRLASGVAAQLIIEHTDEY